MSKRLPTQPYKLPRPAVKVVRSFRRVAQSNFISSILADWESAVLRSLTRDAIFAIAVGMVIFLATVDFFNLTDGPLKELFIKYKDTLVGKWCFTNAPKLNGLATMTPVVMKFKPTGRMAAAVVMGVAVVMMHPASEWTYGIIALLILVALELRHPINLFVVGSTLFLIVGLNLSHKVKQLNLFPDNEWEEFMEYKRARTVNRGDSLSSSNAGNSYKHTRANVVQ